MYSAIKIKLHRTIKGMDKICEAVGSLVVRAPDSEPEGLGSMPVPPNILQVHTEKVLIKLVGLNVLWAESRVQGTGENISPHLSSMPKLWRWR
ncbi:hypothetical protein TNCV_3396361 [Trichonephila clavipes]|nr:hypothetical protein TNCV_3396361 [Trichonephila clavipes]